MKDIKTPEEFRTKDPYPNTHSGLRKSEWNDKTVKEYAEYYHQEQLKAEMLVMSCTFFIQDPDNCNTSSSTKCTCGREKWEHPIKAY